MWKSILFLYASNEKLEKNLKTYKWTRQKLKYLGRNCTYYILDLYIEKLENSNEGNQRRPK